MTAEKRECVSILVGAGLSIVKACPFVGIGRSTFYRPERDWRKADAAVIDAINAELKKSPRAGFWKCFGRMRFKGFAFNHKRVYRVYCQMGQNLKRRTKCVLPKRIAQPLEVLARVNHQWALDFMHDTLYCGKRFRTLNVVDEGTRECLAIEVDNSLPAGRVVRLLEQLKAERGAQAAARRQRPGTDISDAHGLVRNAQYQTDLHPAGQTTAKWLRRTLQRLVPQRVPGCLPV